MAVLHAAFCAFARLRQGGAAFRQRRTAARRGFESVRPFGA